MTRGLLWVLFAACSLLAAGCKDKGDKEGGAARGKDCRPEVVKVLGPFSLGQSKADAGKAAKARGMAFQPSVGPQGEAMTAYYELPPPGRGKYRMYFDGDRLVHIKLTDLGLAQFPQQMWSLVGLMGLPDAAPLHGGRTDWVDPCTKRHLRVWDGAGGASIELADYAGMKSDALTKLRGRNLEQLDQAIAQTREALGGGKPCGPDRWQALGKAVLDWCANQGDEALCGSLRHAFALCRRLDTFEDEQHFTRELEQATSDRFELFLSAFDGTYIIELARDGDAWKVENLVLEPNDDGLIDEMPGNMGDGR